MPHRFIEFAGHFGKRFFGVPDPLFSQGGRRYMYKYLLFDLDGTITKSEEGIFNCIKYALDWAGIPYPEYRVFRSFIGPSLYDSFVREFGMDDAKAKEMVAKYRAVLYCIYYHPVLVHSNLTHTSLRILELH